MLFLSFNCQAFVCLPFSSPLLILSFPSSKYILLLRDEVNIYSCKIERIVPSLEWPEKVSMLSSSRSKEGCWSCWPFKVTFDTWRIKKKKRAGISWLTDRQEKDIHTTRGQDDTPFTSNIIPHQRQSQEKKNKRIKKGKKEHKKKSREKTSPCDEAIKFLAVTKRSPFKMKEIQSDWQHCEESCWWKGSSHGHLVRPTQQTTRNRTVEWRMCSYSYYTTAVGKFGSHTQLQNWPSFTRDRKRTESRNSMTGWGTPKNFSLLKVIFLPATSSHYILCIMTTCICDAWTCPSCLIFRFDLMLYVDVTSEAKTWRDIQEGNPRKDTS